MRRQAHGHGPLELKPALQMGAEICAGVAFLHRNGIMHRDIKPQNVLLDGSGHAKVADFGLSKDYLSNKYRYAGGHVDADAGRGGEVAGGMAHHTGFAGTLRYMAPEVRTIAMPAPAGATEAGVPSTCYDASCDVYSFGLVLWEMVHAKIAFGGKTPIAAALEAAKGARPEIALPPEQADLGALICACWHQEPSARLSMPECLEQLAKMAEAFGTNAADGAGAMQRVDIVDPRKRAPRYMAPVGVSSSSSSSWAGQAVMASPGETVEDRADPTKLGEEHAPWRADPAAERGR